MVFPPSLEAVRRYFKCLVGRPMANKSWLRAVERFSTSSLAKGEYFIREGDQADRAGLVARGLMEIGYTTPEGRAVVRTFCYEKRPLVSPYSALASGRRSDVSIRALESSDLAVIQFRDYRDLVAGDGDWADFDRQAVTYTLLNREMHERHLAAVSGSERYVAFVRDYPDLAERIRQIDLAAYLGLTPVSLNRILRGKSATVAARPTGTGRRKAGTTTN